MNTRYGYRYKELFPHPLTKGFLIKGNKMSPLMKLIPDFEKSKSGLKKVAYNVNILSSHGGLECKGVKLAFS